MQAGHRWRAGTCSHAVQARKYKPSLEVPHAGEVGRPKESSTIRCPTEVGSPFFLVDQTGIRVDGRAAW